MRRQQESPDPLFRYRSSESPRLRDLEGMLSQISGYAANVVVTGESGVGKEELARRLHALACDGDAFPFIAVNCGAITESLMEAELFGYEKGAFTGAVRAKKGVFEQAHGGTLFLDEIGEMPLSMQVKLLRALQNRVVMRLGSEKTLSVDFRLICATNSDLKKLIVKRQFREDLFYRINVIHMRVPPLRARWEDIWWLASTFLQEHNSRYPEHAKTIDPVATGILRSHSWPGNVRELKHCIERACIIAKNPVIKKEDLFERTDESTCANDVAPSGLKTHLQSCEKGHILEVLARNEWAIGETAKQLDVSRKLLWERMKKYEIPSRPLTKPREAPQA